MNDIYDFLEICVDLKILLEYFEIYCPRCNRYTKNYFQTLSSIPKVVYCSNCDEIDDGEIENPVEHAIVIYKVL